MQIPNEIEELSIEDCREIIDSVTPEQEEEIYTELGQMATSHATGLLEVLPYNPKKYKFQKLSVTHLEPATTSIEDVRFYGQGAYARFNDQVRTWEGRPDLLEAHIRETQELGHNLIHTTSHASSIIDIAVEEGSHLVAYDDISRAENSHIVVSEIIKVLGAFGQPAPEILQKMGHVWFSFPPTHSMRKSGVNPRVAFARNQIMQEDGLNPVLEQGGQELAMAPGGSSAIIDKFKPSGKMRKVTLHGVGDGTSRILQGNIVQPVHVWMDPDHHLFEIGEAHYFEVGDKGKQQVSDMMQDFADVLHRHLDIKVDCDHDRSLVRRIGQVVTRVKQGY